MSRRGRRQKGWIGALSVVGIGAATFLFAMSLSVGTAVAVEGGTADPEVDGTLSVEVTDDSPTPKPSSSSSSRPPVIPPRPSSPGTSSSGGDSTSVATQATIPEPTTADDALGDEPVVADGVLAMSGLTASASPSIAVGNGTLTVSFVVRNLSAAPFSSTATFWVDNAFGGLIAKTGAMAIDDLQPDETRRVQVVFEGLGQHIVLNVNATLTPPAEIAGTPVDPISRDSTVVVPPWFSLAVVSVIAVLGRLGWWVYSPRGLGLRLGRFGA